MNKPNYRPPKIFQFFFERLILPQDRESLPGDFAEMYQTIASNSGKLSALIWYMFQIGKIFTVNVIFWWPQMVKNYLKISMRHIRKQKYHSLINISGMSLGMTIFIMIALIVRDELSVDKFHLNGDRIYRVIRTDKESASLEKVALTQAPLASYLKRDFPEIEKSACFNYCDNRFVTYKDHTFSEKMLSFAESSFFELFSYTFLLGDKKTALLDPHSVVINEEIAQKYFGNEIPLGKILHIQDMPDVKVTGVIKNHKNTHLRFTLVFPFKLYKEMGVDINTWQRYNYNTYLLLHKDTNSDEFSEKIRDYLSLYANDPKRKLELQPLHKIYLYSDMAYDVHTVTSSINIVYVLSIIALFVLLIACINFINLSTAKATSRISEVGLRKVVGAYRKQLFFQFLGESLIIAILALFFALLLVEFLLPNINNLLLNFKDLRLFSSGNFQIYIGTLGIAIFTGILAGSYPAFYISSFQPVDILQNSKINRASKGTFRKVLVVCQFSFSIFLIIATLIVFKQISFMNNKDLGYNKENLLFCFMNQSIKNSYLTLKSELQQHSNIEHVTACMNLPTWQQPSFILTSWEGKTDDREIVMHHGSVDYDFYETFKINMVKGRQFSKQFTSDINSAFILNEEAVRIMELDEPLGKHLNIFNHTGQIIGVMEDYHFNSMHSKIGPILYILSPKETNFMIVRIKPENINDTVQYIQEKWNNIDPDNAFNSKFLDDHLSQMYFGDHTLYRIASYAAYLSLFVSCLGLLGLSAFSAQQRTKEIGIRKVLGATLNKILLLQSSEYVKLILISNIISWPLAYFAMKNFLQQYAYRIHIGFDLFLFSAVITFTIALLTISYQSIKAARLNPVDTLRYE